MGGIDRARAEAAIIEFLKAIGHDPEGEDDLRGTGKRVTDAYLDELCKGEQDDPGAPLRANKIAASGAEDLVVLRDVPIATMCPHHLMPATGTATVAFQPKRHIVGIGAIGDVLEILSRRLTLQETIGEKVADVVLRELDAIWVGCRLSLSHTCLVVRDEKRHGAFVETVALRGAFDRALAYRVLGAIS